MDFSANLLCYKLFFGLCSLLLESCLCRPFALYKYHIVFQVFVSENKQDRPERDGLAGAFLKSLILSSREFYGKNSKF